MAAVNQELIDKLKGKITAEDHYSDDDTLRRFLLATGGDLDKAATLHRENVIWRKQFAVDKLDLAAVYDELDTGKLVSPDILDKDGRPVLIMRPRFINKANVDLLQSMKLIVYLLEKRINQVKSTVGEVAIIVDFTDASLKHVDFRIPRTLLQIVQDHYPRRVGRVNVVNPPWFFKYVWSVVSAWMDPHFRTLVTVGSASTLNDAYTPENILEELGGKKAFDFREWNRAKVNEEKLDVSALVKKKGEEKADESEPDNLLVQAMQDEAMNESLDKADMVGFLTKLGGVVKNWKRRYCILKHGLLRYYETEQSMKPQGTIILERARVELPDEAFKKDHGKDHAFIIYTPLRTWYLYADNEEEKKKWMSAIAEQIKIATK